MSEAFPGYTSEKEANRKLVAPKLSPLPLGSIQPKGWLLHQLKVQAQGLTGHLDEFWPDVADSRWIGGKAEGWERAPYWLDGLIPLAWSLNDENLKAKARRWLDYILDNQREDGWLGPVFDGKFGYEYDPWPSFIILKVLTQYYEATGEERVIRAIKGCLHKIDAILDEKPLESWAKMRWPDLLVSINWLYDRTGEGWLLDFAEKVHRQGYDWLSHFAEFAYKERQDKWTYEGHVVNNAMAIKHGGVWYRHSRAEKDLAAVFQAINTLDEYHGQVSGVFSGDEALAGKNPSQGTELCAVVEYLFSLETLLTITAEPELADRLERIAYNALPATFKPDMWAHQYVQQANQVVCEVSPEPLYTTNGPESNLYGLEPNFGCCTANLHQGWPKFVSHLWMKWPEKGGDGGLVALAYAPCRVETTIKGASVKLEVATNYPFEETITITVSVESPISFALHLRIPKWAQGAEIMLETQKVDLSPTNQFYKLETVWQGTTSLTLRLPMPVKVQQRYNGAVSIERGPLVYSLRIEEEWKYLKGELPHADWEVFPASPWNFALLLNPAAPHKYLSFHSNRVKAPGQGDSASGESIFSPENAPVVAKVKGLRLADWKLERHAAGVLPTSPRKLEGDKTEAELEELTLIPYGCTNLRISEFPWLVSNEQKTESQFEDNEIK